MTKAPAQEMSRVTAEYIAALATLALGLTIVFGARQYGTGWSESGPEAGAFPFYCGLLVVVASAGNLIAAWRKRHVALEFLNAVQLRRIAAFGVPLLLFVLAAVFLGFYVATTLYLGAVMRLQGGYRWLTTLAVAIGTSIFFFVLLEIWFKVPLIKGPLEAAFGLH